jgi:hypothetical protein
MAGERRKQIMTEIKARAATELKFHGPLLKMLNVEPRISAEAQSVLAERQRSVGIEFPASVLELLSVEGGPRFLHQFAQDQELPLEKLGEDIVKVWHCKSVATPREYDRYMRVSTENQAVVAFYVKLDGSQDPPVFDNDDTWEEEYEFTSFPYNFLSPSFTTFVFDRVAFGKFWNVDFLFSADDVIPNDHVMQILQRDLAVGPQSENQGRRTLRLFDQRSVVYITQANREEQKAKWEILTDSEASASALIAAIWKGGILRETLRCDKTGGAGDRLLNQLRSER